MTTTPDQRRRRRRRVLAAVLLVALLLPFVVGCTSTVTPPATPADPVRVFLLQEAMHTGLVLPPAEHSPGDAEYVEFGFGDWSWYALGHDAWYHAFATVLWPTQGGLGRRTFGARTAAELQLAVTWAKLSPIDVSATKAAALRRRLQAEFDAHVEAAVLRQDLGFRFVPVDQSYWLPHNCADAATDWLRELDCKVTGALLRTSLCLQRRED
jgi:hypothetical protein